jgi:GT2 family glycosyltransferase
MNPGISIIIPNYNGKELLERNLPSVYNALKTSDISDFEIIIADDDSKDSSVEFVKSQYPDIILIENKTNYGFGGNCNTGISKACKELVMLLNNDVVLTDGYFTPLLPYFEKPDTFGVMSRIVGLDSDKIQDGAKYPDYSFGNISPNKNYICSSQSSLYSLYLSGANALVDRNKLLELGGFDEIFNPFYLEDVDLGLRAWRTGYKCYYEHNAICRHPSSSTIKKEFSKEVKIVAKRNKMYLHFIHLNNVELAWFLVILTIKAFFRTLFLDVNYLKSYWLFLTSLKKCRYSRHKIRELQEQKNVQKSLKEVIGFISKSIPKNGIETF